MTSGDSPSFQNGFPSKPQDCDSEFQKQTGAIPKTHASGSFLKRYSQPLSRQLFSSDEECQGSGDGNSQDPGKPSSIPATEDSSVCDLCRGIGQYIAKDRSKIIILSEEESNLLSFKHCFQIEKICEEHYFREIRAAKLKKNCINPLNMKKHQPKVVKEIVNIQFMTDVER